MQKKRKIGVLLYELCSEFEETVGKFVQGIANIDQGATARSNSRSSAVPKEKPQIPRPMKRRRIEQEDVLDDADDQDQFEKSDDSDEEQEEENDEENEEEQEEENDEEKEEENDEEQEEENDEEKAEENDKEQEEENDKEQEEEDDEEQEEEDDDKEDEDGEGNGRDGRDDDDDDSGGNGGDYGGQGRHYDRSLNDESSIDSGTTQQYYLNTMSKKRQCKLRWKEE